MKLICVFFLIFLILPSCYSSKKSDSEMNPIFEDVLRKNKGIRMTIEPIEESK